MEINIVEFNTKKQWKTNYSLTGDKIITPLKGLEIEIADGERLEVRIVDGLQLIEEIFEQACWNEEDGVKQVEAVRRDLQKTWMESSPEQRLKLKGAIDKVLPLLKFSRECLIAQCGKRILRELLLVGGSTEDVIQGYIDLLVYYRYEEDE